MKCPLVLVLAVLLPGCALLPANESKSANSKTAGQMSTEQQTSVRAVLGDFRTAVSTRTNGYGKIEVEARTITNTADQERFSYKFTESVPVLLSIGAGLLLIGMGLFLLLRFHQAAKASSASYAAVSNVADTAIGGGISLVENLVAVEKEDRVQSLLNTIKGELNKGRGKINSI